MKKRDVINLIKYYTEGNTTAFRDVAYQIAVDFNMSGDTQLGSYVLALLSDKNTFVPQSLNGTMDYLKKLSTKTGSLPLPQAISDEIYGIINAIGYHAGINKFLFSGKPGTGKTESTKNLARILGRELYAVDFDALIDSKLGQTSKNISSLFDEINNLNFPEKIIILFDEIDSLAMDRIDSNDLREMGRATSSVLKGLDTLNTDVVLIATTNLADSFDNALLRRFDKIIDFNQYSQEDLVDISKHILDEQLLIFKFAGKNNTLFEKIIRLFKPIPFPGELKNLIRSSIAFSSPTEPFEYLRKLYKKACPTSSGDVKELKEHGFTIREIEQLTKISKTQVARILSTREVSE